MLSPPFLITTLPIHNSILLSSHLNPNPPTRTLIIINYILITWPSKRGANNCYAWMAMGKEKERATELANVPVNHSTDSDGNGRTHPPPARLRNGKTIQKRRIALCPLKALSWNKAHGLFRTNRRRAQHTRRRQFGHNCDYIVILLKRNTMTCSLIDNYR